MWPPKGEAASGFLARLITESGSSGLGTGVGDVASVGVTNAEDDVSQTVNMKENRGYQHSHCVCVGGNGPEVRWQEREGGRVQLFRFVRSSAPPPPTPSSTSASWSSSSPDSISTSPSPSTLIGRVVVLPRGCTPNDLGHDADSDIGFINNALDSVSRNHPRPPTSVPSPQQPRGLVSCGSHISSRVRAPQTTSSWSSATTNTVLSITTTDPPPKKRKRTRTRAQERELARIRRLDPADQICALLAIKEDRVRYLQEGPGTVYFTGQRDDHGELIVKWGETSCLSRRQLEMWFVAFEVQRRLLAERVIRLGLIGQGYGRVRFEEPCSCGTSHREYHWMRPGGSLEEIETIARECLATIEESTVIR
ncbi:hypothetical protein B0H14DRAFT_2632463 [Mycena olivaceomarginata]|nr:hypothetical protein B0H14DRAFT_2632463 [Mycena olivaceomarginata]